MSSSLRTARWLGWQIAALLFSALIAHASTVQYVTSYAGPYVGYDAAETACEAAARADYADRCSGYWARQADGSHRIDSPVITSFDDSDPDVLVAHQSYFSYVDSCPEGTRADANGLCEDSTCPSGDTFQQFMDLSTQQSLPSVIVLQGCKWSVSGGMASTCLVGQQSDGSPGSACNITFTSLGESADGSDTGKPPASSIAAAEGGEYHAPTTNSTDDPPPVESNNADGSTQTTKSSTQNATGGGFAVVKHDGGSASITQKENSSYSVEKTEVATSRQDGSGSKQVTVTRTFQNGDTYVYNISSSGSVSVTRTPGKSGSSSSTSETDVGSDGHVTTNTSSSGSTSDANFACDDETGRCVYVDDDGDGVGSDNDSDPCNEGDGTDCDSDGDTSGSGSDDGSGGVEGSGTCDPSHGDCGQSDDGGKFAGSPFPSLDDQPTVAESSSKLVSDLRGTPLMSSILGISADVPNSGDCPFGSKHIGYLDVDIDFSSGCDLYNDNRSVLSSAAKAAWSLLGVVILLGI